MNTNVSLIESIFQSTVTNVLKDLPGCLRHIDDIMVSGKTKKN